MSVLYMNQKNAFLSYANHAPLREHYTREELNLRNSILSDTSYLPILNNTLRPSGITLTQEDVLSVFESYASQEFPLSTSSRERFTAYLLKKVSPTPKRQETYQQYLVRARMPSGQQFMPYPEIDSTAGGRSTF